MLNPKQDKVTDDKEAYDELFNSWSKETVYESEDKFEDEDKDIEDEDD